MKNPDRERIAYPEEQGTPVSCSDAAALQLPADIMEIGDTQQLNTALIQQLDHAATILKAWIASGERKGGDAVRRHVRGFLIGMNVYHRLPLGFRLQALDELAPASRTGDAKIMLAMLAAYQQAMTQLPGEKHTCFRIQIMAHAIKQAARFHRHCLAMYQALDVRVINRVLHLSHSGVELVTMAGECTAETHMLNHAICRHELIRKIDFFSQTRPVQEQLWQDVLSLTEGLDVHYFDAGEQLPPLPETAFMVSDLSRPASAPRVLTRLPAKFPHATWVIPIQALLNKARQTRWQYKLALSDMQTRDQATALTSIQCILDTLGQPHRYSNRKVQTGQHVWLEWNAADAISSWHGSARASRRHSPPWRIVDMHEGGLGLECARPDAVRGEVGALVGIGWPADSSHPGLGFLRWRRSETEHSCRVGIEFLRLNVVVKKCVTAGSNPMRRVIPVLFPASTEHNTAIFPVGRLRTGADFVLLDAGERAFIRVLTVLKTGPNYTVCKIEYHEERKQDT